MPNRSIDSFGTKSTDVVTVRGAFRQRPLRCCRLVEAGSQTDFALIRCSSRRRLHEPLVRRSFTRHGPLDFASERSQGPSRQRGGRRGHLVVPPLARRSADLPGRRASVRAVLLSEGRHVHGPRFCVLLSARDDAVRYAVLQHRGRVCRRGQRHLWLPTPDHSVRVRRQPHVLSDRSGLQRRLYAGDVVRGVGAMRTAVQGAECGVHVRQRVLQRHLPARRLRFPLHLKRAKEHPQRDSNPCRHLERVVS